MTYWKIDKTKTHDRKKKTQHIEDKQLEKAQNDCRKDRGNPAHFNE